MSLSILTTCDNDKENDDCPGPAGPGTLEIEFDNLAIVDDIPGQLHLQEVSSTSCNYQNAMGQDFNLTFLR